MIIHTKKLFSDAHLPERGSSGAVGFDLYAYHQLDRKTREHIADLPAAIAPDDAALFGIGLSFAIPFPYDGQLRPRSGLANKHNIELSNSPGTIDPDYRGEVSVLLRNRGKEFFKVEREMRIAQLVITRVEVPVFTEVANLSATSRGQGGFGSTGLGVIALGDEEYHKAQERMDRYYLESAVSIANLSGCLRGAKQTKDGAWECDDRGRYIGATRRFGCIIVKEGNIVGQGCNIRSSDCSEKEGCIRDRMHIPTGESLELGCVHAEEVAVQNHGRIGGASLKDAVVYINAEPCKRCARLLGGLGIAAVVVPHNVYPTNGLLLLQGGGIEVRQVKL